MSEPNYSPALVAEAADLGLTVEEHIDLLLSGSDPVLGTGVYAE